MKRAFASVIPLGLFLLSGCNWLVDMDQLHSCLWDIRMTGDPWRRVVKNKFKEKLKTDENLFSEYVATVWFWFPENEKANSEWNSQDVQEMWQDRLRTGVQLDRSPHSPFHKHLVYDIGYGFINEGAHFYTLWFAVGRDSVIHCLWQIDQFNELLAEEKLNIEADSTVMSVLNYFVGYYNSPAEGLTIIVDSVDEILKPTDTNYQELKAIIRPRQIINTQQGSTVEFYTWKYWSSWRHRIDEEGVQVWEEWLGWIARWRVAIAANGILKIVSKEKIKFCSRKV